MRRMRLSMKVASTCFAVLLACQAAFADDMPASVAGMHGDDMMAAMHAATGASVKEARMMTAEEAGAKAPQFHEEVSADGRLTMVTESDIPSMKTSFAATKGDVMSLVPEQAAAKGSMEADMAGPTGRLVNRLDTFLAETAGSSFNAPATSTAATPQGYAGVAPDPTICSSSQYVITAANSIIGIRFANTTTGAFLPGYPKGMRNFFNEFAGNVTNFSGPKCIYDKVADRFILTVFLKWGPANSAKSSIYVAISAQPDPSGAWRTYLFDGRGLNDGCTAAPCYVGNPSLGQNKDTFMIAADLFNPQGVQIAPKIWVCPKKYGPGSILCRTLSGYSSRGYQVSNVQPNTDFTADGKAFLVGPYFEGTAVSTNTLVAWVISGADAAGVAVSGGVSFSAGFLIVLAFTISPPVAITQANGVPVTAGDTRLTCLNLVGPNLYLAVGTTLNGKASMLFAALSTASLINGVNPVVFSNTYTPPGTLGLAFPTVTASSSGAVVWTASLAGSTAQQYAAAAGGINPNALGTSPPTARVDRVLFFTQAASNQYLVGPLVGGQVIAGSYSGASIDQNNVAWMISQQGQTYDPAYTAPLTRNWGTVLWKLAP